MEQDIVFRKIRGRIVPIKVKEKNKTDYAKAGLSAAFLAGGVGTAIGSGRKAGRNLRKAERISRMSERFIMEKSDFLSMRAKGSPARAFKIAKGKLRKSKRLAFGGQILGGVLMAQGVKKALESQGLETDNLLGEVGSEFLIEGGTQVSAAVINREMKKAVAGKKNVSKVAKFTNKALSKIFKRKLGFR